MPNVILNNVEIYLDARTESQWNSMSDKVIPKGFPCVVLSSNKTFLKIGDGTSTFESLPIIGFIDSTQIDTEIEKYLSDYYTSEQTDLAISEAISSLGTVFNLKGRVDSVSDLPSTNNKSGDVYLVGKENSDEFYEYYWTSDTWDYMGITSEIDLSNYYNKTEVNNLLNNKVDAIEGKGLSTNDFSTVEKNKLNSLENYDDSELKARISELETNSIKATDKLILNCCLS